MTEPSIAAVVMAGGLGTRMKSAVPKHFHPILGRRMVDWVIESGRAAGAGPTVAVRWPAPPDKYAGTVEIAVQDPPLGTGDAVRVAREALDGRAADVLVLSGDTPLLTPELLDDLVAAHRSAGAAATILSTIPADPRLYGRVIRADGGEVLRVAEGRAASPEELAVREVNTSIYVFRSDDLWPALDRLEPKNVQGELYLTDTIEILASAGKHVAAYAAPDARETDGVNTRA